MGGGGGGGSKSGVGFQYIYQTQVNYMRPSINKQKVKSSGLIVMISLHWCSSASASSWVLSVTLHCSLMSDHLLLSWYFWPSTISGSDAGDFHWRNGVL